MKKNRRQKSISHTLYRQCIRKQKTLRKFELLQIRKLKIIKFQFAKKRIMKIILFFSKIFQIFSKNVICSYVSKFFVIERSSRSKIIMWHAIVFEYQNRCFTIAFVSIIFRIHDKTQWFMILTLWYKHIRNSRICILFLWNILKNFLVFVIQHIIKHDKREKTCDNWMSQHACRKTSNAT